MQMSCVAFGLTDVWHVSTEVEMVRKFAQLEFRHGSVERGKTLFENMVTTYPRRTDIWSVYIDVCVKFGDIDQARLNCCLYIFIPCINCSLPSKIPSLSNVNCIL